MKLARMILVAALGLALCGALSAQQREFKKKKLLAIGQSMGYQHDAVSYGLATIWKLGQESGMFDTCIRTDTELVTQNKLDKNAKNLDYFDAILFYTSGELTMDEQQKKDFLTFVRDEGKGFIAVYSANDTFFEWPEYGEMVGGYFDGHPWNRFDAPIIVEDREHPISRHFPEEITVYDEIYQARAFSRDKVRVLMRLDESKLDLSKKGVNRTDKDFAVSWLREYGKGRVFYSTFGHTEEAWNRPDVQEMYLEAIKWAMGMTDGDNSPRPKPAK